jgi:hypothetical protein
MAKKKSLATVKSPRATQKVLKELRSFGLAYPGAHTKSPWPGHLDLAVHDKTFAYLSIEGDPFSIVQAAAVCRRRPDASVLHSDQLRARQERLGERVIP